MKILSDPMSLLPSLTFRDLRPEANKILSQNLLASPSSMLPGRYYDIVDVLQRILSGLRELEVCDEGERKTALQGSIMNLTELLMHKTSSLQEALLKAVACLSVESRSVRKLRQALDEVITQKFKLPINLVKHDGCSLQWLEAKFSEGILSGFVVNGLVGENLYAPVNHGVKPKPVAEGYSFPSVLREAFLSIYTMCSISEGVLWKSGALEEEKVNAGEQNKNDLLKIKNLISGLNGLSLYCFPSEHGQMVSEFSLHENTVVETKKFRLTAIKNCRFTFTLPRVEEGMSYKMPYWISR